MKQGQVGQAGHDTQNQGQIGQGQVAQGQSQSQVAQAPGQFAQAPTQVAQAAQIYSPISSAWEMDLVVTQVAEPDPVAAFGTVPIDPG